MTPLLVLLLMVLQPPAPPASASEVRSYVLGAEDQVVVRVLDLEEIPATPIRIDLRGNINIPLAGRIRAAGLTVEQLEAEITKRLRSLVNEPEVTVTIAEFRSQPVSLLGSVMRPGVHQIQGRKTLFEVLSLAEGLKPDAGHTIKITRRKEMGPIPLPGAKEDETGQFSVAEVKVRSILEAKNPQENILVQPNDVISVPRADLIYVTGSVRKPGGFVLGDRETVSVLQAVALAEGMLNTAAANNARILRAQAGSTERSEILVDLKKVLSGGAKDVPLRAEDILFVPNSKMKTGVIRGLEAAIQVGTGVAIYRR
jgi:polysaccharide export outer membrane protein